MASTSMTKKDMLTTERLMSDMVRNNSSAYRVMKTGMWTMERLASDIRTKNGIQGSTAGRRAVWQAARGKERLRDANG